jgi:hypothetical protein
MAAFHDDRKRSAFFAAQQALMFANGPRTDVHLAAAGFVRRFADSEHAIADARGLLEFGLRDLDPLSVEAFQVHAALSLLDEVGKAQR